LLDWRKQISVIFQQILQVQQFLLGMFVNDGKEIPHQYSLLLPIQAIMGGDMPFLNKVVGMHGGLNGNFICQFCNIQRDDLDNPSCNFIEMDSHKLPKKMKRNMTAVKDMGYYPIQSIVHQLTFCHSKGINQSTLVEPLYCVSWIIHMITTRIQ